MSLSLVITLPIAGCSIWKMQLRFLNPFSPVARSVCGSAKMKGWKKHCFRGWSMRLKRAKPGKISTAKKNVFQRKPDGQPRAKPHTWEENFLRAMAESGNLAYSCRKAKIGRRTPYNEREKNSAFAQAWDDAYQTAVDRWEQEALRRGYEGVPKPIYHGGKEVGSVREFSDVLLMFMLNGARPEKYRPQSRRDGDEGGGNSEYHVIVNAVLGDEAARSLLQALDERLAELRHHGDASAVRALRESSADEVADEAAPRKAK